MLALWRARADSVLRCVPEARGKHALAFEIKLELGETGILNLEEKPQLGLGREERKKRYRREGTG